MTSNLRSGDREPKKALGWDVGKKLLPVRVEGLGWDLFGRSYREQVQGWGQRMAQLSRGGLSHLVAIKLGGCVVTAVQPQ